MTIGISCPTPASSEPPYKTYKILIVNQRRVIKANGTLIRKAGEDLTYRWTPTDSVKAEVFNHPLKLGDPELNAPGPNARSLNVSGQFWCIDDLPAPVPAAIGSGSGSGPPLLAIVAWELDPLNPTNVEFVDFVNFSVSDTTGEICPGCVGGSGSGTGNGEMVVAGGMESSSRRVGLAMAPLVWGLTALGWEFGKTQFSGLLSLHFQCGCGGFCVWDNGGDGVRIPQVELRCESPLATTWQLTIRQQDRPELVYVRPAAEWNPLTPNIVHRTTKNGVVAPEQLTLVPG